MPRTSRQIGEVSANPEAFNLVRATLTHHDEFDVDIKGLIQKIDIFEDINKPFLEVIVFIKDSTNFLELTHINGHEDVFIKIQREAGGEVRNSKETFELVLKVAEVFNYIREEPGVQYYKLRCVSEHLYMNQTKVLRRSFQGSIGKLVEDICDKDLEIPIKTINRDTQEIIKGIYPTLRPIQSINWLLRNAYDNGTPYYFYETTQDGVQFNSLENLYDQEVYNEYEFKPFFEHDMGTQAGFDEQARRITSFGSELGMSKLEGMANGSYASTLHSLDIYDKEYKKEFFNYDESQPKKLEAKNPFSENTVIGEGQRKLPEMKEGKNYFLSRNTGAFSDTSHKNYHEPNHITLLKGSSHLSTINFMTHNFALPGDFNMTVGKLVKLNIIKASEMKELDDPAVPLDKYLGGKYLVTSVQHSIGPESYNMFLRVQKDSLERGIELGK